MGITLKNHVSFDFFLWVSPLEIVEPFPQNSYSGRKGERNCGVPSQEHIGFTTFP